MKTIKFIKKENQTAIWQNEDGSFGTQDYTIHYFQGISFKKAKDFDESGVIFEIPKNYSVYKNIATKMWIIEEEVSHEDYRTVSMEATFQDAKDWIADGGVEGEEDYDA